MASTAPSIVSDFVEGFRLTGHTTFDMMMLYGRAGLKQSGINHLSAATKIALATSVATLGWDLVLLQEPRYRPVWNGLFGMAAGYRIVAAPTADAGPPIEKAIHFNGPFSAVNNGLAPCLFADPMTGWRAPSGVTTKRTRNQR